jgi:hypothetical protein
MNPFLSFRPGFVPAAFIFLMSANRAFSATAYDTLEANRQKWNADHPHEYAFTYHLSCYCITPVWRVSVEGDSVVRVENISASAPGTPSDLRSYSIDSIFARVEAGLDAHPVSARFRYNARWGYPEEASFNKSLEIADDEYSYNVTEFTDLTVAIRAPRSPSRGAARKGLNVGPEDGMSRDLRGRLDPRPGAGPVFRISR